MTWSGIKLLVSWAIGEHSTQCEINKFKKFLII